MFTLLIKCHFLIGKTQHEAQRMYSDLDPWFFIKYVCKGKRVPTRNDDSPATPLCG